MKNKLGTALAVYALLAAVQPALAQRLDTRIDNNKQDTAACHGTDPDKAINGCTNLIRAAADTVGIPGADNSAGCGITNCTGSIATMSVTSSINTNPVIADATITRAANYLKKSRYDDAITDCTRVITFLPQDPICYGTRAAALLGKNMIDNALVDAEKAVSMRPNNADMLVIRAQVYEKLGATDEAVADYRKAAELDPMQLTAQASLVRLKAK